MLNDEIFDLIAQTFGHPFTPTQERAATLLAHFVTTPLVKKIMVLGEYEESEE